MDSGTAAIIGAALGLMGSLLGTVVVPAITRRRGQRDQMERDRLAALRRIIPELLETSTSLLGKIEKDSVVRVMAHVGELETWLRRDEWQIGRIALLGSLGAVKTKEEDGKHQGAKLRVLVTVLPAWMRGDISAEQAARYWKAETGIELTPAIPNEYRSA